MQFQTFDTYEALSKAAAVAIAEEVRANPRAVLGLATGSTPLGLYRELIRLHREEGLSFAQVKTFNLDEYYGLAPDHSQSYHHFMWENLFSHIDISKENINIPSGTPDDVDAYCRAYDARINEVGGIDLQILGIGTNGHIGFNEPGEELTPRCHRVQLAEATIEANARFFDNAADVPRTAITMGMESILQAKKIMLLANGEAKAPVIGKLQTSGITTKIPATLLRLHRHVHVYVDAAAASQLAR